MHQDSTLAYVQPYLHHQVAVEIHLGAFPPSPPTPPAPPPQPPHPPLPPVTPDSTVIVAGFVILQVGSLALSIQVINADRDSANTVGVDRQGRLRCSQSCRGHYPQAHL